ncbi:hypothetical protein RND71_015566 [Anisodus tanguticus]|uniref:Uncharacterized protein n=1 Tax=Anisodus tanguticus TaxID=243964 RepID=A0AAE1VBX7_9SOLA|nr:hypothetical protein RND71_015566 [Anisodus tanguticus]
MLWVERKNDVYGLSSQVLTLYQDCNSATSHNLSAVTDCASAERIKLLRGRGAVYERKSTEDSSTACRGRGATTRRAGGLAFEATKW